jgi:heme-degrading monooxygenase HmoA
MLSNFALNLKLPYYAVIFSSQRTDGDNGYAALADRMVELAQQQPGYLGVESARDENGFGITVSYWDSEENIKAWRKNAEHREVQATGISTWYSQFETRVAKVERAYGSNLTKLS